MGDAGAATEGTDDGEATEASDDIVRLTVPAEGDFVAIVRLIVQAVAARSGCTDDTRSRLRAAVGSAFFELAHDVGPEGAVLVELEVDPAGVAVDLTGLSSGTGNGPRRTVRVEVDHPPLPG